MVNWYQYFHEFLEVMFMIAVSFFIIAGRFMSLKLIMFKNIFGQQMIFFAYNLNTNVVISMQNVENK